MTQSKESALNEMGRWSGLNLQYLLLWNLFWNFSWKYLFCLCTKVKQEQADSLSLYHVNFSESKVLSCSYQKGERAIVT